MIWTKFDVAGVFVSTTSEPILTPHPCHTTLLFILLLLCCLCVCWLQPFLDPVLHSETRNKSQKTFSTNILALPVHQSLSDCRIIKTHSTWLRFVIAQYTLLLLSSIYLFSWRCLWDAIHHPATRCPWTLFLFLSPDLPFLTSVLSSPSFLHS